MSQKAILGVIQTSPLLRSVGHRDCKKGMNSVEMTIVKFTKIGGWEERGKRKKMELKITSGGQFGNNDFKIKNFTPKHATFAIRRTECTLGPYLFIHSCKFVLQLLAPRFIPRCLLQFYLQHKKIKPRQEFQRRLAKC